MERVRRKYTKVVPTTRHSETREGIPSQRLGMPIHGKQINQLVESTSPWYESAEEVQERLESANYNRELVVWVREAMRKHLNPIEVEIIERRYLYGETLREIGMNIDRNPSTVMRISRNGISKLRKHLGIDF